MSIAKDNIAVTAPIVPYLPGENDFPSHYAKYGCGGWREVEDIEERDNIPNSYRSIGMVVYVKSEKKILKRIVFFKKSNY